KRAYCLKTQPATGETYPKSDLFNKAYHHLWYISAMVLGGIILFALRDKPYSLALSLFLFIIGCCLQYL
ncbi:hypothetical protein ACJWU5_26950, partial [Klebsiella pneumoniae]